MHHVLARLTFKPESANAAKAILTELVSKSRQEPGCISYELYRQVDAPHIFQTVEQWRASTDADAHMTTAHVAAAIAAAGAMFAAPPEIVAWDKVM